MTDRLAEPVIIGDAMLYLGDCCEILPELTAAVMLTDPPYGIHYQSGYATRALWAAGYRITNDETTAARDAALALFGGPAIIFGSRKVKEPAGTRMVLTWDKGPALGMGALDLPWKPSTEEIYVIGSGWVGERDEGSCLYCPPVQSMAKNGRLHPNEKPMALIMRLMRKCPAGIVLDPFMGSGTTGVACAKLGRKFIGIEIEPKYFDIACRRIEQAYAQPDMFIQPAPKPVQSEML